MQKETDYDVKFKSWWYTYFMESYLCFIDL